MLATYNCWNLLDISPKLCKWIIPLLVEIMEYIHIYLYNYRFVFVSISLYPIDMSIGGAQQATNYCISNPWAKYVSLPNIVNKLQVLGNLSMILIKYI